MFRLARSTSRLCLGWPLGSSAATTRSENKKKVRWQCAMSSLLKNKGLLRKRPGDLLYAFSVAGSSWPLVFAFGSKPDFFWKFGCGLWIAFWSLVLARHAKRTLLIDPAWHESAPPGLVAYGGTARRHTGQTGPCGRGPLLIFTSTYSSPS